MKLHAIEIKLLRTDWAPDLVAELGGNEWLVQVGEGEECVHSTGHRDLDDALMMVRVIAERQEREERGQQ